MQLYLSQSACLLNAADCGCDKALIYRIPHYYNLAYWKKQEYSILLVFFKESGYNNGDFCKLPLCPDPPLGQELFARSHKMTAKASENDAPFQSKRSRNT